MGSIRYELLHAHKHEFLLTATIASSLFALTTTPSFIPLVIHISILLFYAPQLFNGRSPVNRRSLFLWLALSVTKSVHWLKPSLNALSTPGASILVLFAHGASTSLIVLITVFVHARSRVFWAHPLFFPALFATAWWGTSQLSPVGYLTSWSPVTGFLGYNWLVPVFGSPIRDWLVAAWAIVISAALETYYMGEESPDESPLLEVPTHGTMDRSRGTLALAMLLVALTVPSYVSPDLPRPISSNGSTPLAIGCALPHAKTNYRELTLSDYIHESTLMNAAQIILWPEGAVSFADETEREAAFAVIRKNITSEYVGVSFEESYWDDGRALKRTGLALVGKSNVTQLLYYKRNLVPIAESYRLESSSDPPALVTIDVKMRQWVGKPKIRPISVTGSICLDFAMPDPFTSLQSRPMLILAPARTWDVSIGAAMWEQVKQRALELDSMVLWCDGGEGGVSGVAAPAQGMNEIIQIGEGSWVRTVGLEYPPDPRPTLNMEWSGWTLIIMWVLGGFSRKLIFRVIRGFEILPSPVRLQQAFSRWRRGNGANELNLLMDD
ncbi:hypothetical protein D9757_005425 [Collybiopsis confluens]|uniref:CN hydrolase domain-containing protein n=1 Tax=Collybiopsis confluens TaxID=2823264 RepID=A0A8H5HL84_9AGAR|nr:hypothetical protein D9757_005425 [Collybiopsis confluens]